MSYSPPITQFTIPGITSFKPEEYVRHESVHEALAKNGWEAGLFYYGEGRTTPFFVAPAKNQRNLVAGLTGMNVAEVLDSNDLRLLNACGTTFVWIPLPKAVKGSPINDHATDLVRTFLTSPQSPINALGHHNCPKFIATHSTSGRIVLDLLHEPKTGERLRRIFSGAVYTSPYLDTANGSMLFHPKKDRLFQAFAQMYKDYAPHETRLGRVYMSRAAKNEPFRETKNADMVYSHILELQEAGRRLLRNFNASAANALPSVIVIGDQDPFACPKTTTVIAEKMGVRPIVVKGGQHYPFRQDSAALRQVMGAIDLWTHQHETRIAEQEKGKETVVKPDKQESIIRSLSNRLGHALQRGASLLYPAAGLF